MKLYTFVCKNITNIWAGIGARKWAVSEAEPSVMAARRTRAVDIRIGQVGIIYCSADGSKSLTTPFIFTSTPEIDGCEEMVWPERWRMPFDIHPLGNPRRQWGVHEAARTLPFALRAQKQDITSIFKVVGTAVFSPIEIGDDDWSMVMERLADRN